MKTKLFPATLLAFLAFAALPNARAGQFDLYGPAGSGAFGTSVTVLPNGNFVVTDPGYDAPGPTADVGAVYLYDGVTLAVISTLTGSSAGGTAKHVTELKFPEVFPILPGHELQPLGSSPGPTFVKPRQLAQGPPQKWTWMRSAP